MPWSWGEPRKGETPTQGSHSSSGCSNATAMIFPLAVALAYLDAIAKTWRAIGEKLHESIYGNVTSSSEGCISRPMTQVKSPPKNHRYNWQRQANRLEFSLGDFLRWKMHDPLGSSSSSCPSEVRSCEDLSHVSEEVYLPSGNGQLCTPSTSAEEATCDDSITSTRSWSCCLRLARRPKHLAPSPRPRATDKTLVLDLDETLIHARKHSALGDGRFDFMVVLPPRKLRGIGICSGRAGHSSTPALGVEGPTSGTGKGFGGWARRNGLIAGFASIFVGLSTGSGRHDTGGASAGKGERRVYVQKRPHLREFLRAASSQFEIVVFTAAREEFASKVLEEIDPNREMVDHVLSRESCTRLRLSRRKSTSFVKDLGIIGRPLSKVIMVENSLDAIRYHLENGIHISSFYGDRSDKELLKTLEVLQELATAADVRDGIISRYVQAEARKAGHVGSLDAPVAPMLG